MAFFSFSFDLGDAEKYKISAVLQSSTPKEAANAALLPLVVVSCPAAVSSPSFSPGQVQLDFASELNTPAGPAERMFRLRKVDIDQHPDTLSSFSVPSNHDIVEGRYGGGYKTWECSLDLVQYLLDCADNIQQRVQAQPAAEYKLLELGCGHGLPGAAALSLLAPSITHAVFSDLNQEVLADTTWPNIRLNGGITCPPSACSVQCVAGDWSHLMSWVGSATTFDLILSAETLYNEDTCRGIVTLLHMFLSPSGIAILANKRYYFGVGGGTVSLENIIAASTVCSAVTGTKLQCEVVRSFEDGTSNIRDIIAVSWAAAT
jgi:hypothetical protein